MKHSSKVNGIACCCSCASASACRESNGVRRARTACEPGIADCLHEPIWWCARRPHRVQCLWGVSLRCVERRLRREGLATHDRMCILFLLPIGHWRNQGFRYSNSHLKDFSIGLAPLQNYCISQVSRSGFTIDHNLFLTFYFIVN